MNDMQILENLFNNKHDEITFQNLEESNIIFSRPTSFLQKSSGKG